MTSTLLCLAQPSDRCRCHFPAQAAGSLDISLSNSGRGVDCGSARWHSGCVRVLPPPAPWRVGGVALHAAVPSGSLSSRRSALLPPAMGGVAVDTCLVQGWRDAFMVPALLLGPPWQRRHLVLKVSTRVAGRYSSLGKHTLGCGDRITPKGALFGRHLHPARERNARGGSAVERSQAAGAFSDRAPPLQSRS